MATQVSAEEAVPVQDDSRPALLAVSASEFLPTLASSYAAVSNLSCSVRRVTSSGGLRGNATVISQVVFARGDRMNVETVAPLHRRVVIDGAKVHDQFEDAAVPTVTPIATLSPAALANLRSVPGSPEEMLAALDSASGVDRLPPASPYARQVVFAPLIRDAPAQATVVSLDANGVVASIIFYADAELTRPLVTVTFSSPTEPLPGVVLFRRMETNANAADGHSVRTVSHFDGYRLNLELPLSQFDPAAYF